MYVFERVGCVCVKGCVCERVVCEKELCVKKVCERVVCDIA